MNIWKLIFGMKHSATQTKSPAPAAPSSAASGPAGSTTMHSSPHASTVPPSGEFPPAASAAGYGSWKAQPIFISSTFKDMHAERDYLRHCVFPRLEEELRNRRHHLEPIDLRLGVETVDVDSEETRELRVLKVCLDEIKRSRPFLLVLLGDRYGWVPTEDRMAAAAREAGFNTEVSGKSVTALEIEFGILKEDTAQRRRSFFYLRQPLPYTDMPTSIRDQYTDAFSADLKVRACYDKLQKLKATLVADPELGSRVHQYAAEWDSAAKKVTGLEAWGEQVFQHLWKELQEETHEFTAKAAPTWQQQERQALAEFVEHAARAFVGRDEITRRLLELARSSSIPDRTERQGGAGGAAVPSDHHAPWGAYVTGCPGSGKSALIAHLHRELEKDSSCLLLANVAGIGARSSSVDAMLRRWIEELAEFLQEKPSLKEDASAEDVDKAFASQLGRASVKKRVVILIDALNQFEATPRAKHLTWCPRLWPANARIIATTLPGQHVEAFGQLRVIEHMNLLPLSEADAEHIARNVWGHYHRELNHKVFLALVGKRLPDGGAAVGNPLWLTLAMEQMNLIDADDFARADRMFSGPPAERLHAMLLKMADQLPTSVEGLYEWMLEQTEKIHGKVVTQAFASVMALGRFGWREKDLLVLVPGAAKVLAANCSCEDFDALKLASLRRAFRGQLIYRGTEAKLDVSHAQMRLAVLQHNLNDPSLRRRLHVFLSTHLLSLSPEDSLRQTETMVHLMGADERLRAARHYGGPLNDAEKDGATQVLTESILRAQESQGNAALEWTTSLLQQREVGLPFLVTLCERFIFSLADSLAGKARLSVCVGILTAARETLTNLISQNPKDSDSKWNLAICHRKLGYAFEDQGNIEAALQEHKASLASRQELPGPDRDRTSRQHGVALTHICIGDLLVAQDDLRGAQTEYEAATSIAESLVKKEPTDATWHTTLSTCSDKMASILERQNRYPQALAIRRASMTAVKLAATEFPEATQFQRDLSISHEQLGSLLLVIGDKRDALRELEAGLTISRRLAQVDPDDAECQQDLSFGELKFGEVLHGLRDFPGALPHLQNALDIAERSASRDPTHARWLMHLAMCAFRLGYAYDELNRKGQAEQYYVRSRDILSLMKSRGMHLEEFESKLLEMVEWWLSNCNETRTSAAEPTGASQVDVVAHLMQVPLEAVLSHEMNGVKRIREVVADESRNANECVPWRIYVYGYSQDPRGLPDIPEVRLWCRDAVAEVPFLPIIVDDETASWLIFCIVETQSVPETGQVAAAPRALWRVLEVAMASMSQFLHEQGIGPHEKIAAACVTRIAKWLGMIY